MWREYESKTAGCQSQTKAPVYVPPFYLEVVDQSVRRLFCCFVDRCVGAFTIIKIGVPMAEWTARQPLVYRDLLSMYVLL